jgi:hypothetical protein
VGGYAAAILGATVAGALSASLIGAPDASAGAHRAQRSLSTEAVSGLQGPRGARGPRGPRGLTGPRGARGAAGSSGPFDDSVTLNWQNGRSASRDSADFAIPGIGEGELECSRSAQWLRVFPVNQRDEVTMWLVRQQDGLPATVRTDRHTKGTGPDFNEGMNRYRGQLVTSGSFAGLISSRGPWTGPGGAGPPPTSFHVSFNWNFTHRASARCYVAAQFITGR